MKKLASDFGHRSAFVLSVVAFAALTACGGGGGSSTGGTTTTPIAAPSITIAARTPDIAGKTGVDTTTAAVLVIDIVSTNISNLTTSMLSSSTGAGNKFSCEGRPVNGVVFTPPFVFTLEAGKIVGKSSSSLIGMPDFSGCSFSMPVTVAGGGAVSNTIDISFSFATGGTNLSYTEKTYALWTGAYPYAVTKTGVTPVVNKTKYTFGARPLTKCIIMDPSFTTKMKGKILTECQASDGSGRHMFYIDPTKEELYEYLDPVPTGMGFHDVTAFDLVRNKAGWDSQTKVAGGWYFTLLSGNWVLWFQSDATGLSSIIKEGTFAVDGNINYMATYSN